MTTYLHTLVEPTLDKIAGAIEMTNSSGKAGYVEYIKGILYQLAKDAYSAGANDTVAEAAPTTTTPEPSVPEPTPEPTPEPVPEPEPLAPAEPEL